MNANELRELTVQELRDREEDLSEQLFNLRQRKVSGQLEQAAKISSVRRDRARVLTVLREKNA